MYSHCRSRMEHRYFLRMVNLTRTNIWVEKCHRHWYILRTLVLGTLKHSPINLGPGSISYLCDPKPQHFYQVRQMANGLLDSVGGFCMWAVSGYKQSWVESCTQWSIPHKYDYFDSHWKAVTFPLSLSHVDKPFAHFPWVWGLEVLAWLCPCQSITSLRTSFTQRFCLLLQVSNQ